MRESLRLMGVFAHPDDESLGAGGLFAASAADGIETSLVTATRGQRGWKGAKDDYPGPDALGRLRTEELEAAAAVLGIRHLAVLDHLDGALDEADADQVTREIAAHIRRLRPHVVVTFGPDGIYGHPDHIAISQLATAAVVRAAAEEGGEAGAHRVSKLYYMVATQGLLDAYQAAFGVFDKRVDDHARQAVAWEEWAVTTRLDARAHTDVVWEAISRHRSQLRDYEKLQGLPADERRRIFGEGTYYRVFSLVNGGRALETDLFAGVPADA